LRIIPIYLKKIVAHSTPTLPSRGEGRELLLKNYFLVKQKLIARKPKISPSFLGEGGVKGRMGIFPKLF